MLYTTIIFFFLFSCMNIDRILAHNGTSSSIEANIGPLGIPIGKWAVGNCISAEFDMKFELPIIIDGALELIDVAIPTTAEAIKNDENCDLNRDFQAMELKWKSYQENDGKIIEGHVVFEFAGLLNAGRKVYLGTLKPLSNKRLYSTYGIKRIYGSFNLTGLELGDDQYTDDNTDSRKIETTSFGAMTGTRFEIDTGDIFRENGQVLYETPFDYQFECPDLAKSKEWGGWITFALQAHKVDKSKGSVPFPETIIGKLGSLKYLAFNDVCLDYTEWLSSFPYKDEKCGKTENLVCTMQEDSPETAEDTQRKQVPQADSESFTTLEIVGFVLGVSIPLIMIITISVICCIRNWRRRQYEELS